MAYYFELNDGKPVWALAQAEIEVEEIDNEGQPATITRTIYLFTQDELSLYPEHEPIEQPSLEILARAAQIEGTTLSRSEFERLLTEKTPDELMREQLAAQQTVIDALILDALMRG